MNDRADGSAQGNILVVDDAPANLRLLSGMLKSRGYKVRPVPSGKAALRAASTEAPDLILLDINMPEMNGYEVCQRLKEDESLRAIPVIFISALSETMDKVKAFGAGGVDYVTKPFQFEEVNARVETHLRIHRLERSLSRTNEELESANHRIEAANVQMKADLVEAARVQQALLPPERYESDTVELAWAYRPCDELGGDSLGYHVLDDRHISLYVLDVTGHGVKAALRSVAATHALSPHLDRSSIVARATVWSEEEWAVSPNATITELNRRFPFEEATNQFMTAVYGLLDTETGEFRYVAAGHPGPILVQPDGSLSVHDAPCPAVGVLEDATYEESTVQVRPGERLVIYSDGLVEEKNEAGDLFGIDRLRSAVQEAASRPIKEMVESLVQQVIAWRGTDHLSDDLTILAVERIVSLDMEETQR